MRSFIAAGLALCAAAAQAEVRIVACEPEWAALAEELGGSLVEAESVTTPLQDVHFIQARPSLIAKVRRADLVFCTGADLEVGWLPLLLRQAGNARIQPGQAGFLAASDYVDLLEKPASVDRAQGDVHPFGNPHVQLDPRNFVAIAAALAERLAMLDAANASAYRERHDDFVARWQVAVARWTGRIAAVRGMPIIVHHRSWVYLASWAGLDEIGALEPKPGVPPSAAYLSQLLEQTQARQVRLIVRAAYQDARASEWLAERAGVPAVVLPHTVGSVADTDDLFALFDRIVAMLVDASS